MTGSMDQHTNAASIDPDPLEVIFTGALAAPLDFAEAFLARRTVVRGVEHVMV